MGLSVKRIPEFVAIPLSICVQARKIFQNHVFASVRRNSLVKTQNWFQIGKHGLDAVVRIWNPEPVQFFEGPQKTHISFYAVIGASEVLMRVVHLPVGMKVRSLRNSFHLRSHSLNSPSNDALSVCTMKYVKSRSSLDASSFGLPVSRCSTVFTWWNWQYWNGYLDNRSLSPRKPSLTIHVISKLWLSSHSTPST